MTGERDVELEKDLLFIAEYARHGGGRFSLSIATSVSLHYHSSSPHRKRTQRRKMGTPGQKDQILQTIREKFKGIRI